MCEQAPYGKGEKTLVDTSVRRVWRLSPGRFSLTNPDWQRLLDETLKTVQINLGLERQKLEGQLHELLLYEQGSFFLPHRDGEKLDRMVATLVVILPSVYEGGELIVRHEGQVATVDFSDVNDRAFRTHFAAFYADCEHEIRPLMRGYRLCLVYNLTLARSKKPISAPRPAEHIERIVPLLREWSRHDEARKLVVTLDHEYTKDGLTWDKLKGVDRAKAHVLGAAARQSDCKAYLALLTLWESGSAVDDGYEYGYRSRRRWQYDEDEDEDAGGGTHEMDEVFESSLTAKQWNDMEGRPIPIPSLRIDEDELLDPSAVRDVEPEEQFEGYTGNAGMTLERWYRHAAVILWPERKHFEVLCDGNGRQVVPLLKQMVDQWKKAGPRNAPAQKEQCLALASAILKTWPESLDRYTHGYGDHSRPEQESDNLLRLLEILGDEQLIARYVTDVLSKDPAADPGKSLVSVCAKHGWEGFRPQLEALLQSTSAGTVERNVGLLEEICQSKERKKGAPAEFCVSASSALVSALETIDQGKPAHDWRLTHIDRAKLLTGLVRALVVTGQFELLERVLAQRAGPAAEVPAQDRSSSRTHQPGAVAEAASPAPARGIDTLDCRLPRAAPGSDRGGTAGAQRLSPHRHDQMQVRGLHRTEAFPGGSRRPGVPLQHAGRTSSPPPGRDLRVSGRPAYDHRSQPIAPHACLHQDHSVVPGGATDQRAGPRITRGSAGHRGQPGGCNNGSHGAGEKAAQESAIGTIRVRMNQESSSRIGFPALSFTGRPVSGAMFSLTGSMPRAFSTVA